MKLKKIYRKGLALILAFNLFFSGVGGGIKKVEAAGEGWTNITTKEGLMAIGSNSNANYRLMADIDLAGVNWVPISGFIGKLDGNSKVIRNLTITDTSNPNRGLFATIGAAGVVTNLGIEGVSITAGDNTGVLAGSNAGTISRSYVKGNVSGNEKVGGIVGINTGTISNSFAAVSVSGKDYIGGLVGLNSGTVDKSYSSSQLAPSVFNNYLQFDGVNDYVSIPDNPNYKSNSFTLEAWFQWDRDEAYRSVPHSDVDFIIGKGFEQYEIHTGGGSGKNGIRFIPITRNGSGDSYIDAHNVLNYGWFHVAAVYSYNEISKLATAKVFINGVAQELFINVSPTSTGTTATMYRDTNPLAANSEPIGIGRRSPDSNGNPSFYFKGKISDVRFWNAARTADQIYADRNKQLTGSEPGLVGYWKLNEALGETAATDSTANHNNGTLYGGITRVQVAAAVNKGGLIGSNTNGITTGTVINSYYDSTVSGQSDSDKGVPKTTDQIKNQAQATFTDWDFDKIWGVNPSQNGGYPYLLPLSTVSFNSNGGSAVSDITGVDYNTTITAPSAPTKTGYTHDGWYKEPGLTNSWVFASDRVTTATTLYAKWAPNTITAYRVQHYWQNTADNGYTLHETENLTGTTDATATAAAKAYAGFTENTSSGSRINNGTIAADGSLVLKLYYDRNTFTVNFSSNGGGTVDAITGVRYDAAITAPAAPTKTGYALGGWYKEPALNSQWVFASDRVTTATTLYAKWTPNTNTAYRVEHYRQNITDNSYTLLEIENLTGTTDAQATAVAKAYEGVTENAVYAGRVSTGTIAADGGLVLKLYYDRNTYAVNFDSNGGSTVTATTGVRYDAAITAPAAPTKTGYTFGGWYKESALTNPWVFGSDNVTTATTLYAKWTASGDTAYKVEHYKQNIADNDYSLLETENLTGTTGAQVTAVAKAYEGVVENTGHAGRVTTGTVAADGSLVLKLYYDRNTYAVSFNSNGGSTVDAITGVRYDAAITAPAAPTKTGYTFGGWYKESELTNPWVFASDKVTTATTLYAKWAANASTSDSGGQSSGTTSPQIKATVEVINDPKAPSIEKNIVENANVVVTAGNNGTETVSMKANEVILVKQSDGTRSPLSDYSNLAISTGSNSNVTISANGTIKVESLDKGKDYNFEVSYSLNGQVINIATMHISVASNGDVSITIDLIDPYGTITDASTGKIIEGANVTLYYANTERNKAAGKIPDTVVQLPLIPGFEPNNNKNPQISDSKGSYAYMVFPFTDYYLVAVKDGYDKYISPIIPVEKEIVKWDFRMNQPLKGIKRISGDNRVDTAISIAKATYGIKVSDVILANSEDYHDALTGSVLAYKLRAPILLVGNSEPDQEKVLSYMKENMNYGGTVYILGGSDAISNDIEAKIKISGFKNVNRLSGADNYETSVKIARKIEAKVGTPIIITSGENFQDALSISSIAAQYQYPILLAGKDSIPDSIKNEISVINPGKIFIIGSEGAISKEVENQALQAASLEKSNIIRISGADPYETSIEVAKHFNLGVNTACITTGNDFPDALAGSLLSANYNAPMVLVDKTLSDNIIGYFRSMKMSGILIFGGEGVVKKEIELQLLQLLGQ